MLDSPRTAHPCGGLRVLLRFIGTEARAGPDPALRPAVPESAYRRFLAVMRRLPPGRARVLADGDRDRRAAIVALAPGGELVGIARYGGLADPGEAEIALVLEDA